MPRRFVRYLIGVYERMNQALYNNVNYPPHGFSGLNNKPLWMCGDKPWKWYTKEMNDPSITPTKPLYLSRPETFKMATGAWIYEQRFITNGRPQGVEICRPDVFATTLAQYDFITFCDFFSDQVVKTKSPVEGKKRRCGKKNSLGRFPKI